MDKNIQAKEGQQRAIAVFEKKPARAQVTNTGKATVSDGLACRFSEAGKTIDIDMPEAIGGTGAAPPPGYFGRAALCSCIAIGIKMCAVREGVELDEVSVSIEQDFDNRGVLGMPGAAAAPSNTCVQINIVSRDPDKQVEALVQRALEIDPWYLAFHKAQPVKVDCATVAEVA